MVNKITKYRIVEQYLRDYGRSYYLREIAKLFRKPHQSIKPYMEQLVKEGVLIRRKRGKIEEYKLNLQDKKLYDYLVIAEKERLLERLQEDTLFKVLFDKIAGYFDNCIFIIFGSFAEGKKAEDIDLLAIGKNPPKKILKDFDEIYNKKIHLVHVKDLNKISPSLIKEIYKKHIILNNTEMIVRWFGDLYGKNQLV